MKLYLNKDEKIALKEWLNTHEILSVSYDGDKQIQVRHRKIPKLKSFEMDRGTSPRLQTHLRIVGDEPDG